MKVMLNTNSLYSSQNKTQMQRPLFKGKVLDSATDKLAKGFANLAKSEKMTNLIENMGKHNVISLLAASTGVVISGFYMYNTAKSKKIEPEHKKPLMVNMGLVTAIATAGGLLINKALDKKITDYMDFFGKRNADKLSQDSINACKTGIKAASSLLIFTMIYRYISPVIVTPIANKISNHFFGKEHGKKVA